MPDTACAGRKRKLKNMKKMNLPNKLTVIRLFLVPVCIAFILLEKVMNADLAAFLAAFVFTAASLTDMFDGKIARKYNLITDFGKFIDPLADKFMVIGCMVAIMLRYGNIREWYFWVVLTVIFREFAVTSLRLICSKNEGIVVAANKLGKIKTTMQIINILCVLMEPVIYHLLFNVILKMSDSKAALFLEKCPVLTVISSILVIIYTLWSGINYIKLYGGHLKESM